MSMKPLKSNIFYSDVVKTSDMGPGSLILLHEMKPC